MGQSEDNEIVQHVPVSHAHLTETDLGTVVRNPDYPGNGNNNDSERERGKPRSRSRRDRSGNRESPNHTHPVAPPSFGASPAASHTTRDSDAHDVYRLSGASSFHLGSQLTARYEGRETESQSSLTMREFAGKVGYGVWPVCSMLVAFRAFGEERIEVGIIAATAVCFSILISDWLHSHTTVYVGEGANRISQLIDEGECDSDQVCTGMSAETVRLLRSDIKKSPDRVQMEANLTSNLTALSQNRVKRSQEFNSMRSMVLHHALPTMVGSFLPLLPLVCLRAAYHSSDDATSHLSKWAYLGLVTGFSALLLLVVTIIARRGDTSLWKMLARYLILLLTTLGISYGVGELVGVV